MDREEHIRLRQEAIAKKKERRERQFAFENSKKKPKLVWFNYPTNDPVGIVRFKMKLVEDGVRIYAHNDDEYALIDG